MPQPNNFNYRKLAAPVLIFVCIALSFIPLFQDTANEHALSDLAAADKYLQKIPENTLIALTPDNVPLSRFVTTNDEGDKILEFLRATRKQRYRPAWGLADIEIVAIPHLLQMPPMKKLETLKRFLLRNETVDVLAGLDPSFNCFAKRYEDNGWSSGGVIFVDPTAMPGSDSAGTCVLAAFDYLSGIPVSGASFKVQDIPTPEVDAVILDFMQACSYAGQTNVYPRRLSGYGITNFPAVKCVQDEVKKAQSIPAQ